MLNHLSFVEFDPVTFLFIFHTGMANPKPYPQVAEIHISEIKAFKGEYSVII